MRPLLALALCLACSSSSEQRVMFVERDGGGSGGAVGTGGDGGAGSAVHFDAGVEAAPMPDAAPEAEADSLIEAAPQDAGIDAPERLFRCYIECDCNVCGDQCFSQGQVESCRQQGGRCVAERSGDGTVVGGWCER